MKIRLSLIFITLSVFFLSCSNGISQKGEGSVTVDLSEFIQKVSSRAADNGQTATVTLRTEGDLVTSVTETVSTSGGSITLDNLPIGKTITISLETTIAHKYFEGFSEPVKIKDGNNQVTIKLAKNGISTDYVLYNYDSGYYNYSLVSSPNASVPEFSEYNTNKNLFCFDNDGYFYYIDGNTIHSDNPKFTSDGVIGIPETVSNITGMTIDLQTNIFYSWYGMQGTFGIYKYSKIVSDANSMVYETINPSFNYDYFGEVYHHNEMLVINNGIAYGFTSGGDPNLLQGKFYKLVLSESVPSAELINIDYESLELSGSAKVSDMLYQDGAVFILLREFGSGNNLCMSRGAIIKYDVNSGSVTSNGFAPETTLTSFKAVCTDGTNPLYKDNGHNEYFTSNFEAAPGYSYILQANWNTINNAFVGPEKFVAIKPKKLVISDTGFAFYTNSGGLLAKKRVNRVVEVDLKNLSIGNTTVVDCKFNTENLNTAFASGFETSATRNSSYKRSGSLYEYDAKPMFLEEE